MTGLGGPKAEGEANLLVASVVARTQGLEGNPLQEGLRRLPEPQGRHGHLGQGLRQGLVGSLLPAQG